MPQSPTRILFVCMGNICRSPLAECVFRHKIQQRGIEHLFEIDSAGTGGWQAGEPPDARVCEIAAAHGVEMCGAARQITRADFTHFDLLLCADESNRQRLLEIGAPAEKTRLLREFDPNTSTNPGVGVGGRDVPDPYYGGDEGFRTVFRLVDAACQGLLDELLAVGK